MAGTRGRLRSSATIPPKKSSSIRKPVRNKPSQGDEDVPEIFQDLLSEVVPSKDAGSDEDRKPLKKRRTTRAAQVPSSPPRAADTQTSHDHTATPADRDGEDEAEGTSARALQTITDSEESKESDMEWEDALVQENDEDESDAEAEPSISDLSITIGGEKEQKPTKSAVKRKGITSVDKKRRLDIHKVHVLCLLYHVHRRNAWCNDARIQASLRKLPSPKMLSNLVPNPEFTQYQASKRFIDGMQDLKAMWTKRFSVTAQGMHKPRWVDADAAVQAFMDFDELDDPMDKQDFRKAASALQGSQDIGAQLFCALLRGIGVEARLVCSLQCLPFVSAAQAPTPQPVKTQKNSIVLDPFNTESSSPSKSARQTPSKPSSRPKRLSKLEQALGERSRAFSAGVAPTQKKKYHSPYPVYWVEAFNPAVQRWIPIDPLSTFTIDKPEKLEPPLSHPQNSLTYAVAFEDDAVAKDVTRRYSKAFNAKTRKFRVESTEDGVKWWKRALKVFKRATLLDRDQVEDAALARKEAAEGLPKNVQDFKDHPLYVLERHLRHNEVIHPKHQVGKINIGTTMNKNMEPVYRRRDVHIVRSADKWYRLGRDVKDGEQPLKHAKLKKRSRKSPTPTMDIDDGGEEVGNALYAPFQTQLYVPPPVKRGRVPRNAFGNLDLYVPSMIPRGGAHIRRAHASKAARLIGIDYADAVTGFQFKGRHGTAVIQGVVVAEEYREAVEAVLDAFEYAQEEAELSQQRAEALRLWRRFYLGLKIAQRVNAYDMGDAPTENVQEQIDEADRGITEEQFAGGFFPDERAAQTSIPSTTRRMPSIYDNTTEGGFIPEETDQPEDGGFIPEQSTEREEGGFLSEDSGGGFIAEPQQGNNSFIPPSLSRFGSSLLEQQRLKPRTEEDYEEELSEESGTEDEAPFQKADDFASDLGELSWKEQSLATEKLQPGDSGGGFIPAEHTEVGGGGFLRDETAVEEPHSRITYEEHGSMQQENSDTSNDESHQKIILTEEGLEDKLDTGDTLNDTNAPEPEGEPEPNQRAPERTTTPPEDESMSDADSLPLEDPEDEDADPEWLVDVT